jgi:hypothetical protein
MPLERDGRRSRPHRGDVPQLFVDIRAPSTPESATGLVEQIQRYVQGRTSLKNRVLLLIFDSGNLAETSICRQLALPLQPHRPSNIVRLVPRTRLSHLGYAVCDLFCNVPDARKVARGFAKQKVWYVGQLVQLSPEQIKAFPFMTDELYTILEAKLKEHKLGFGSLVPSYNRSRRGMPMLPS